jgi:4a-hydroxytetrahydrobiopterin dehydratase
VSRRALSDEDLAQLLDEHPEWSAIEGRLVRVATLDFSRSCEWLASIAAHCDAVQHHPVVTVTYGHLRVEVFTHDRPTLTSWDSALVAYLDECWPTAADPTGPST